jgi:hypothetical protein
MGGIHLIPPCIISTLGTQDGWLVTAVTILNGHIFVTCPRANAIWAQLGFDVAPGSHNTPWLLGCAVHSP